MAISKSLKPPFTVLSAILVLSLTVYAEKEKSVKNETYSFNVVPGNQISIENEQGDISVEGWDRATCEVNVFKTSSHTSNFQKIKINPDEKPDRLTIKTNYVGKLDGETTVDYIVSVPSNVGLQLKTSQGKVQVKEVKGRLLVSVGKGDIALASVDGSIEGRTGTGNINLELKSPDTEISSLKTEAGSINANFDKGANASIWAEVEDGAIKSNLPLRPVQSNDANLLKGQLGSGGKLVHLLVGRGGIDLSIPGGTGIAADALPPAPVAKSTNPPPVDSISTERHPSVDRTESSDNPPQRRTYSAEVFLARTRSKNSPAGDPPQNNPSSNIPVTARTENLPPNRSENPPAKRTENPPAKPKARDNAARPSATGRSGQGDLIFNVDTNLITLNTNVKDRRTGKNIGHLEKKDFVIYEDHAAQEVAIFTPVETPFNLLLLLDISGSITEQFHIVQEASIRFTQMMRPDDRIAVAVFNTKFKLLSDFTNDRRRLSEAILNASPGGGTNFYDAMYKCVDTVFRGIKGRKAIVVFTDGVDNQLEGMGGSRITFSELFHVIEETDINIYPIFLDTEGDMPARMPVPIARGGRVGIGQIIIDILGGGGGSVPVIGGSPGNGRSEAEIYAQARKELQEMAEQTGGQMYSPRHSSDLRGVYEQIVEELSQQYSLGYYSTNPTNDGKWHRISVKIKDQPDYVARTRRGYYATLNARNSDPQDRGPRRFDRRTN